MDVRVGEVTSTIRAADSQALLSPALLEQITAAVLARLRMELDRERRVKLEGTLQPALPSVRDLPWEGR
jgi:hypothetical protein